MGYYGTQREAISHNINQVTITLGGTEKVEGLDMITVELNDDETAIFKVGDGTAQLVDYPDVDGTITITLSPTSQTNLWFWNKYKSKEAFSFSMADTAIKELATAAKQCKIKKRPIIQKQKDPQTVEWVLLSPYITCRSGNFTLASAA